MSSLVGLLTTLIKYGVIIFIIVYPLYLFREHLKKAGDWMKKNILKKKKTEEKNNGNLK